MRQELGRKSYSELKRNHPNLVALCKQGTSSVEVRETLTPQGVFGSTLSLHISRPSLRDASEVIGRISAKFFDRSKRDLLGNSTQDLPTSTYLKYSQTENSSVSVEVDNSQEGIDPHDVTAKAAIGLRMLQAFHETTQDEMREERNAYNMWRDLTPEEIRMMNAFQTESLEIKAKS